MRLRFAMLAMSSGLLLGTHAACMSVSTLLCNDVQMLTEEAPKIIQ